MHAFSLLLVSLAIGAQSGAQTKRFSNPETGMMFDYPAAWTTVINKSNAKFTIQLPQSGKVAVLEVFAISFRLSVERWQELQTQINKDLKREITRQWQEEILGVPMLLTQVAFATGGQAFTGMTGLMYSATPRKLSFRLIAPATGYDEALQLYKTMLQSMRTISGETIAAENPNAPPPAKNTKQNLPSEPPKPPRVLPSETSKNGRRGEIEVSTTVAGRNATLYVPKGWTVSNQANEITLTREKLSGTISVAVFSTLDSPIPERKMNIESGNALELFSSVTKREDSGVKRNDVGATVQSARRFGADGQGRQLIVWHAVGLSGDYYWLLTYKSNDLKQFSKEQGIVDDLIKRLSVTGPK